jgi:hypothetical protein
MMQWNFQTYETISLRQLKDKIEKWKENVSRQVFKRDEVRTLYRVYQRALRDYQSIGCSTPHAGERMMVHNIWF